MENLGISKGVLTILISIIIILIIILLLIIIFPEEKVNFVNIDDIKEEFFNQDKITDNITVVPTMQDTISKNSVWCPTFQLVWNDMQDNLVNGNVKFLNEEESSMLENLNKQSFKVDDISSSYYYKNWGLMNKTLKMQIEKDLLNKFNETSDILNSFEWPDITSGEKYFFYSMLKKDFEFDNEFDKLENKKFANAEDVEYFGVDENSNSVLRDQITVLYYTDESNFAVKLSTKDNDEVILEKHPKGNSFEEIYDNINKKSSKYNKNKKFNDNDTLSIPNLKLDVLKEYSELENKSFSTKDGKIFAIDKAVQSIQMKLNNKGGSIKSEAAMSIVKGMAPVDNKPRHFDFDDEFVIFVKEEGKEKPYFAGYISDINLYK